MHMQDRESMGDEGKRVSDRARKSGRQEARTRGTKAKPVNVIFKKGRQEIKWMAERKKKKKKEEKKGAAHPLCLFSAS